MAKKSYVSLFAGSLAFVVFAVVFLNYRTILDEIKSMSYSPSPDMSEIRNRLDLTSKGTLIFNAASPVLDSRDDFNRDCSSSDPEVAVYGCYHSDKIFVYDINNPELVGFRESTTAHELLHAVWFRLPKNEKNRLIPLLEQVYSENEDLFKETLASYADSERIDELYVRSATQVKNLPKELETHYSEIFKDQDKIVDYYNSYIAPFKELEAKNAEIAKGLEQEKYLIDQKTAEYESRSANFNVAVENFNSCADTEGCFTSRYEFNTKRNALIATSSELDALYEELSALIDDYNEKVDEYNSNLVHETTLQNLINSNSKLETPESE